jgi:hypothetical protein
VKLTLNPSSVADYETFLKVKSLPRYRVVGRTVEFPDEYAGRLGIVPDRPIGGGYVPVPGLFDYQRDIAAMACEKRRFAAFVEPGYGKTFMLSEFVRNAVANLRRGQCALMVAPLMVVPQTVDEIQRFYGGDLKMRVVKASELSDWLMHGDDWIGITNWDAIRDDTPAGRLGALAADESSMLKSAYGKHGQNLVRLGRGLTWKMAATGTPAPNDRIEFANHAVFLDQFPTVNAFLARYFVNRGETANRWELKPHALGPFYRSLSHWSIFVTDPGTYGWKDNAGSLPPIYIHHHDVPLTDEQVAVVQGATGTLMGTSPGGITGRSVLSQIAKGNHRGQAVATNKPAFIRELVASWPDESTLVWCLYNAEQESIERALPDAASISGDTPLADRMRIIGDLKAGRVRTLISKPEILGFGLNLQVCTRQVFSGLQDSYEEFWQAVKRSNRVGSTRPLNVHIPATPIERPMIQTVLDKAARIAADTAEQERIFSREAKLSGRAKCAGTL